MSKFKKPRSRNIDGIEPNVVYDEWATLCRMAGLEPTPVWWSEELDEEHAKDRRRYASVVTDSGILALAKKFRRLPPEHRLGIYAHEIGHRVLIEAGKVDHQESEADQAAFEALGVEIVYDMRWPGKGLQRAWRAPEDVWLVVDPVGVMTWYPERVGGTT